MFRTTMLAIVAVLALQPIDSLAAHITDQQFNAAYQGLLAKDDALQAQIDELTVPPGMKTVFVTSGIYPGDLAVRLLVTQAV